MEKPLISVIVPVYKVEPYINRCVESIVNQTYKNLEIILVDDGSPDNCPKMCDEWAEKDNRLKVIHKQNGGLSDARNAGLDIASGKYVMYCDSDDWIEHDMIYLLLNTIEENNADVSRCGIITDFEDGSASELSGNSEIKILSSKDEMIIDLVMGDYLSGVVWNKLYKYDIVNNIRFDGKDGSSEDILYNFRVIQNAKSIACCDVPKYHYLIRERSITNSPFSEGAFSIVRAKKIILSSQIDNEATLEYCKKSFVASAFVVLNGMIRNDMFMDKFSEMRKSILNYKRSIFNSSLYSFKDKIKTLLLLVFPNLYKRIIR